jgi:hypothetical protein
LTVKDKAENAIFQPIPSFEGLAVPFWPRLQPNYIWPYGAALRNRNDFMAFAGRWENIEVLS